jgi:hypothetical protein
MVDLANNAWHACTFNRRSVGVEVGGSANRGFEAPLVAATARMFAYLCHHLQIPVRHARAGVGPGIASHCDLGSAGGGYRDPSDDPTFMEKFVCWSMTSIVKVISRGVGSAQAAEAVSVFTS